MTAALSPALSFSARSFPTALLGAALFSALLSTPAQAQSEADAGSSAPAQSAPPPPPAAAEAPAPEPEAPAPAPGSRPRFVPKVLQGGPRLSENLQNWLHDRGTGRPPRIARNAAAAAPAQPEREPGAFDESAGAIRSRRMRSFDEAGITVISNRLSQSPDALTRVAPARVAGPAPRPPRPEPTEVEPELEREAERELDREPRRVTQTRSLRAARFAGPKHAFEDGFGWATLAAGGSALGLAALWFRRRGRVPRS